MLGFRLVTAIVLLVVASACGSTPSSHGSTQSPGATPSEALFAVVEGRSVATQPGTVANLPLTDLFLSDLWSVACRGCFRQR